MLVTLSGIVMLIRLVQPSKAQFPMLVTLSGIVMLVRLVQPEKTETPILTTPSGMVTSPPIEPKAIATILPESIKNNPSELAYLPLNDTREVHPANTPSPMLVTLLGIVMLVRLVQF